MRKDVCTIRQSEERKGSIRKIGDGSFTKGIDVLYEFYEMNHTAELRIDDDQFVLLKTREEIAKPPDPKMADYRLRALDHWILQSGHPTAIEEYPPVFELYGDGTAQVGKVLKYLVEGGFMQLVRGGFEPLVWCNNGMPDEEFDMLYQRYKTIVESGFERTDLGRKMVV